MKIVAINVIKYSIVFLTLSILIIFGKNLFDLFLAMGLLFLLMEVLNLRKINKAR